MVMAGRFRFRCEIIDMPNASHPGFAAILKTMTAKFGHAGTDWDFDVVERVKGFPTLRVGVTTQADWETVESYRHLGLL